MNVVGIDVSKGKSTVAVMTPGEGTIDPFEIAHDKDGFESLAGMVERLEGETKVVMESTGRYHVLLAEYLSSRGLFVSVVNSKLVCGFGNNSIRRVKNDRIDAVKICNYGATYWNELPRYESEEETRRDLRELGRQRNDLLKIRTSLNNQLISLVDVAFPGINVLLDSTKSDGSTKWVDFISRYHSASNVAAMSLWNFRTSYRVFCRRNGYCHSPSKADALHAEAVRLSPGTRVSEATCMMLDIHAGQLQTVSRSLAQISTKMHELSERLPEYGIVMQMYGVGKNLGPQLMAEIGDVRRFHSKKALVAFAGIDPPPYQSGRFEAKSRRISKRGSPQLRKALFLAMTIHVRTCAEDQDVYRFIRKKMDEGKHYHSALVAGANKFLRQYYAKVKEVLVQNGTD